MINIIVPVYNEEKTIEIVINKLLGLNFEKRIIIIDDASIDNTKNILEKFSSIENIKIIHLKENQGKGFAIRTALKYIEEGIVVVQDADLELEINEIEKLIKPLLENKAEVVYGTRFHTKNMFKWILDMYKKDDRKNLRTFLFYFTFGSGNFLLTFLTNLLYNLNITDEATCYKIMRIDLLKSLNLESKRFEFCPEVNAKLGNKKIKILEIPISFNPRRYKHGKKIKLFDGFYAIYILFKYKFIK